MRETVEKYIKDFVKGYPDTKNTETRWLEPIIAYADAKNESFYQLKEVVTPSHGLPTDFLEDAKTVITYFLPFEEEVVESNIEGKESSRTWGVAYIETNQLIFDLNTYLHEKIQEMDFESTIIPATHNFDEDLLISEWSHRHVAYIAGLGKFGLNNMLITEKGCCGRVGSIVTNLEIPPTEVTEKEFCLYKAKGVCKLCVSGCVNGALQVEGYDRHKCYEMCLYNDKLSGDLGVTDVCGKCMVAVPCSFKNPMGK
ncbi:hypothetical protein SAMN05660297_01377 [Natronincola peptidivorans]|uniref:Epoxyqueuosine reductase QueG (Queuosine biosynthesis) n=1 Tax=Natronincola peptidivorans TaxID=426128 RepID=A0A1I0BQR1_9FIRM|nr:epoxyqueuosine reductase [Natronincola peptidivorans]SET09231.1 hypothetical protein SAMN05660297_01377 [Natronincola peptidivorans]